MATLTEHEVKLVTLALDSLKEPVKVRRAITDLSAPPSKLTCKSQIDMEMLARKGGYKSAKTARDVWNRVNKKVPAAAAACIEGTSEDKASGDTPAATKATPKKRGRPATTAAANEDEDHDEEELTAPDPKKRLFKAETDSDS